MASSNDKQMPDIAFGLEQLGQEVTAADLVRSRGQSTKLNVMSKKKLQSWIESILNQHLAGQADAMSDEEKQELLAKAQMEIQRRMKLEQELAKEKDRRAKEVEEAQAKLSSSAKSTTDYEAAIAAYKAQLEQRDKTIEDLQQDTFELQDDLNQKVTLLRTTIEEKDRDREKLQNSLRNQMVRSTGLLEGVIGLDNDYYGERHQNELPRDEDASAEEQFYHDFDVGAAIIQTLAADLGRLREIAKGAGSEGELLESDLALLAQLKEGSLGAMDVASPVASLVEATRGARKAAQELEIATNEATGLPAPKVALSAVPDSEGDPAEVIAGTTQVVRELESLLARERARLGALKTMADQADAARNAGEAELEAMRLAYDGLVDQVSQQGVAADIDVPSNLNDNELDPAVRAEAAKAVLVRIGENAGKKADPEVRALETAIAASIRNLGANVAESRKERGEPNAQLSGRVVDLEKLIARLDQDQSTVDSGELLATTRAALDAVQDELAERSQHLAGQADALKHAEAEARAAAQRADAAEAALHEARHAQADISAHIRDLGQHVFPSDGATGPDVTGSYNVGQSRIAALDRSLAGDDPAATVEATRGAIEALRRDATKHREKFTKARSDNERLDTENRELHDRVDQLGKELSESRGRADELLRSERELSQQLIEAAQGDEALADVAADLAVTIDDPDATVSDLNAHSKLAVAQLVKRKQQLDEELAALRAKSEELNTRTIARSTGLQAEIAKLAEEVAGKDSELTQVRSELSDLQGAVEQERADAVETAASAKEIIQQMRSQMESRDAELAILREQSEQNESELASLRENASGTETTTKLLGDTLTGLARLAGDDSDLAPAREALEHALGEMPGEAGIALRPEAAERIAKAAQGLVGTMALRSSELREADQQSSQELAAATARKADLENEHAALVARVSELEAELTNLSADSVETAATAKEMIQALQSQVASRDEKLRDLKAHDEQASRELADIQGRFSQVDHANRILAENMAALATSEMATAPELGQLEGIEEARLDLELVLSELPAEGETGVEISADIGPRLAEAGGRAAAALAARRKAIAEDLTEAQRQMVTLGERTKILDSELAVARKALSEKDAAIKRVQAELESTQSDIKSQAVQLAETAAGLTSTRGQLASAQSELEDLRSRVEAQEAELATAGNESERANALAQELAGVQAISAATLAANEQMRDALLSLTQFDDREVANRVAAPGSDLAKAASRLAAREDRSPEQFASAGGEFVSTVRDQLAALSSEVASARQDHANESAQADDLRSHLSAAKTTLVAREQELEQARAEAAQQAERALAAEAAAAAVAGTIAELGDDPALTNLASDPQRLSDPESVQQVIGAARGIAERARTQDGERQRLSEALAATTEDRDRIKSQFDQIKAEASARTREADEARDSERAVAAAAGELGRELLVAAKAAAADNNPESSKEAAAILNSYDDLTPERRVAAAAGFMPTLRELVTNLTIAQAEAASEIEASRDRHDQELAALRSDVERAAAERARLEDQAAALAVERDRLNDALADAQRSLNSAAESSKELDEQLLQAHAELDEFRARGSASTGSAADENKDLKQSLDSTRARLGDAETQLAELREKLETTEARMNKSREELSARLTERDQLIVEKTHELEELASNQADAHAIQAKVEALSTELAEAHKQLQQYRSAHGDLSGANAQAGDLRKTLKNAEAEREALRTKLRELESELAERKGELEEAQASAGAKQKEILNLRAKKDQEIEAERAALAKAREGERQLKEENVGLKARVRRLTER